MSSAREAEPPVGQLDRLGVDHGDVADPHELARLLAVAGADVDVQLADLGDLLALLVAQQVDRLLADDAREPAPPRVSSTTRWPTRICGSQPPTSPNHRKPSSSMWVTISPISSMWPITSSRARRRASPLRRRDAGERRADGVGADLGEAAGGVAPGGRRGLLVAGGARAR